MSDVIKLKALAKINLGLDVLGRRENGYHDVRMVMQSIYLYDNVTIEKKEEPGIQLVTNLKFLPVDEVVEYKFITMKDWMGVEKGIWNEEISNREVVPYKGLVLELTIETFRQH